MEQISQGYKSEEFLQLVAEHEALKKKHNETLAILEGMKEKEKFDALLLENVHDVVWVVDLSFQRKYVSPSIQGQRGYSVEEALRQSLEEIFHPEDLEFVTNLFAVEMAKEMRVRHSRDYNQTLEARVLHKEGHYVWVEMRVKFLRDVQGKVNGLLGVSREIEDRKKAETALRESESKYRALFTDTLEALSITQDGILTDVNREWLLLHGFSEKNEVIGMNVASFIHPDEREKFLDRRKKQFDNQQRRVHEIRDCRKDGSEVYVEVYSNTLVFNNQKMILSAIRDITEKKRAEAQLLEAHKKLEIKARELEEANKELTSYAYMISHDMKAPLRSIQNNLTLLKEAFTEQLNTQEQKHFDTLDFSVKELRYLIERILELSMISESDFKLEAINLDQFFANLTECFKQPDISIGKPSEWPEFYSEPSLLKQIFQNLIGNALKFNRSKLKIIELGWLPQSNGFEFYVRDNGIGIDARFHQKIFEYFFRLNHKDQFEGSGVGLTIVRKAVQRLNGSIRLESEKGKGSCFYVFLPQEKIKLG